MAEQAGKILVAYYSLAGETLGESWDIVKLEKGFTAQAAEVIHGAVGGDLFEIETVEPYPDSHRLRVEQSRLEIEEGHRPKLKSLPDSFERYQTVFLCYPVWWFAIPPAMASFAEALDWSGKRIVPLATSHSSGPANSGNDLRTLCCGALVEAPTGVLGQHVERLHSQIAEWAMRQMGVH